MNSVLILIIVWKKFPSNLKSCVELFLCAFEKSYGVSSLQILRILNFGVSTPILNTTDISRSWCKLNFGPLWSHVKKHHFPERKDVRRQYFYFLYEFLEIICRKEPEQPFWKMIWLYYYLSYGIRLDLDSDNSCWMQ